MAGVNKVIIVGNLGNDPEVRYTPSGSAVATISVANEEPGDFDKSPLESAKVIKSSFNSKGRGFSGVVKRYNFGGGPKSHGSRFHRAPGSIGNCEFPWRVMPGKKMPGHYGNKNVTVNAKVVEFDPEMGVLVIKGSVPGANGSLGKVRIVKWV